MPKTITICASGSFYKKVNEVADQLEVLGFKTKVPSTALKMKKTGDYDIDKHKTWFGDANDYPRKAELMREHFQKIDEADAVLIINEEKHGQPNYIGGNVLMEMSMAFWQKKPVYIYNGLPKESAFEEEIKGMLPVVLNQDLGKIEK